MMMTVDIYIHERRGERTKERTKKKREIGGYWLVTCRSLFTYHTSIWSVTEQISSNNHIHHVFEQYIVQMTLAKNSCIRVIDIHQYVVDDSTVYIEKKIQFVSCWFTEYYSSIRRSRNFIPYDTLSIFIIIFLILFVQIIIKNEQDTHKIKVWEKERFTIIIWTIERRKERAV